MADKVMFTAVAAQGGNFGPFPTNRTLKFDTIITNVGGGYDNTSGEFTAPLTGVYYFTFSYEAKEDNKSGLSLMKNSSVIVKGADNNKKGEYLTDNGGNSAILQLQSGDKVSVQLPANHCVWTADNTTSFSGFLIAK
ncbi:complement C1q-like protein 4 [Sparus aurata]|uniref:Complement C1q-like protein 4 n=1 Tax=Sparus aurata TaxID=8175 RepID=A0A671VV18_SPAAU|nr:complement C1q-like protein 4 [Sparus aurata]